jgi:HSP20 family protein
MAGVTKEDLEVEINNKAVRISGQRSEGTRMERSTYRLAEIQYGRFERFLFLPCMIDTEVVSSSYSNGFLEIRLAKLHPERAYKVPIEEG